LTVLERMREMEIEEAVGLVRSTVLRMRRRYRISKRHDLETEEIC
jgi:hypothetical protein